MQGYSELRERAAWLDLSSRGKIRVTGEDRVRFVHAMSTNHVRNLEPRQGLYAFFLNDKGRILADAYIYNLGESLFLETEPETRQKLLQHLDRYLIADDATLEEESEKWAVLAVEGPQSVQVLTSLAIPVSEMPYSVAELENGFVARTQAAAKDGFRLFMLASEKLSWIDRFRHAGIPQADDEAARTVRIENAIPRYGEEITERYLVQEANQLHALHTNKGCYLGQEIVERVRARGQVHRVLMPVLIHAKNAPAAGTKLSAEGKDVAEIASAVFSPALGEVAGLAYVRTEAARQKPKAVVSGSEPAMEAEIL
jgi:folate-binding protein YgfZ